MSTKTREDEWFQNFEQEMIRDAKRRRKQVAKAALSKEAEELRELHFMHCPKCGSTLNSLDLEGITVDKCPQCEGIFFDRGELDELLLKKAEERRGVFRRLAGLLS